MNLSFLSLLIISLLVLSWSAVILIGVLGRFKTNKSNTNNAPLNSINTPNVYTKPHTRTDNMTHDVKQASKATSNNKPFGDTDKASHDNNGTTPSKDVIPHRKKGQNNTENILKNTSKDKQRKSNTEKYEKFNINEDLRNNKHTETGKNKPPSLNKVKSLTNRQRNFNKPKGIAKHEFDKSKIEVRHVTTPSETEKQILRQPVKRISKDSDMHNMRIAKVKEDPRQIRKNKGVIKHNGNVYKSPTKLKSKNTKKLMNKRGRFNESSKNTKMLNNDEKNRRKSTLHRQI